MYQFASGAFISGLFTAHEALTAGQPILVNSDGELAVATDDLAIHGVVTTDTAVGLHVGFQGNGFLRTTMIDGSGQAIAIGDQLEVDTGKFIKLNNGVAVAVALTAVTTNMATTVKADAYDSGLTLPLIKLL